jgi:hypothetical protein
MTMWEVDDACARSRDPTASGAENEKLVIDYQRRADNHTRVQRRFEQWLQS